MKWEGTLKVVCDRKLGKSVFPMRIFERIGRLVRIPAVRETKEIKKILDYVHIQG